MLVGTHKQPRAPQQHVNKHGNEPMLISCQYCNQKINKSIRYCPHCGGENRREAITTSPLCPRCECALEENEYRDSTIDICPQCQGLWLDTDEFGFHTSERDTFADESIPRKYDKQPFFDKAGYIKCVRCDALMIRKNFRRISGVLIDICRDHGIWLDAGELEQLRCFIANGGLDKSQDKGILDNSIEIAKVARETRDLKTFFKILNKWSVKRILLQGF